MSAIGSGSGLAQQLLVAAATVLGCAAAVIVLWTRLHRSPPQDGQPRRLLMVAFLALVAAGVMLVISDAVGDAVAFLIIAVIAALLGALVPRGTATNEGPLNDA